MGGQSVALGQQQGQEGQPLLTLGAVGAQIVSVVLGGEIVAVGAVSREAALEIEL
jgi:sorbitol-specific phosphotransferase system component IIBC